jgi:hypothetical protein
MIHAVLHEVPKLKIHVKVSGKLCRNKSSFMNIKHGEVKDIKKA